LSAEIGRKYIPVLASKSSGILAKKSAANIYKIGRRNWPQIYPCIGFKKHTKLDRKYTSTLAAINICNLSFILDNKYCIGCLPSIPPASTASHRLTGKIGVNVADSKFISRPNPTPKSRDFYPGQ
jgi:hypothetical protein